MSSITLKAYAKINLGLDVVDRLPNGYHLVKMVMQTVGIYDELTFEKIESGIVITTDSGELPTDENNLIYKAAKLMQETYHIAAGIKIHLIKNIPIAAGMAGGSTDAAATMKGINMLFGLNIPDSELMRISVAIGADVPYCILGGTALAEGIGERLTALPPTPACTVLVAKPDISVSTKYVYEHLDSVGVQQHPDIDGMVTSIKSNNLDGVIERLENVLEAVTVPAYPVIDAIKQRMLEAGADGSLMSGSGPTVFGLYKNKAAAEHTLHLLETDGIAKQLFLTTFV